MARSLITDGTDTRITLGLVREAGRPRSEIVAHIRTAFAASLGVRPYDVAALVRPTVGVGPPCPFSLERWYDGMTASEIVGKVVVVHTDGACSPNPGPGGWGAILRYGDAVREICGGEAATTNNRMELMAAIQALETLTRPSKVVLNTDSVYVKSGIQSWIVNWKRNGWITSARQPVKNADLWQRLDAAIARHDIEWLWVKGHSGDPGNERADELAGQGMRETIGDAGGLYARSARTPMIIAERVADVPTLFSTSHAEARTAE